MADDLDVGTLKGGAEFDASPAVAGMNDLINSLEDLKRKSAEVADSAKQAAEAEKIAGEAHTEVASKARALGEAYKDPVGAMKTYGQELISNVISGNETAIAVFGLTAAAAIGLGVGLVELAATARHAGDEINALHETSGLSIPAISNLRFAWEAAGGTFGQLSNLMFTLESRMESSGEKVDKGLHLIGMSLAQINAMPADDRLLAIADGIGKIEDPTKRAAATMLILGKQGRDALHQLVEPLSELNEKSKELGFQWSNENAKAADAFQDSLNELNATSNHTWEQLGLHVSIADLFVMGYTRMKLAIANVAFEAVHLGQILAELTGVSWTDAIVDTIRGAKVPLSEINGEAQAGVAKWKAYRDSLKTAATGLTEWNGEVSKVSASVKGATISEADLKAVTKDLTEEYKKNEDAQKKHQAALKVSQTEATKLKEFENNLNSSIKDLSGSQIEATRYYLDQGKTVSDTAKIVGIYQQQVEQVKQSQKDEIEIKKVLIEIVKMEAVGMTANIDGLKKVGLIRNDEIELIKTQIAHLKMLNDVRQIEGSLRPTISGIPQAPGMEKPDLPAGFIEAQRKAKEFRDGLDALAGSMVQLAQVSGDSFGGIAKDLANIIVSWNAASKAQQQYLAANNNTERAAAIGGGAAATLSGTGQGSTLGRTAAGALSGMGTGAMIGTMVGGPAGAVVGGTIGAIAGGAMGLYRGIMANNEAKNVNDLRDKYQETFGEGEEGLRRMNEAAVDAGASLDRLLNATATKEFTAAQRELNAVIERHKQLLDEANSKYGEGSGKLKELANTARDVYNEMLTSGQYSAEQLAEAWTDAFAAHNRALGDAQQTLADAAADSGYKTRAELEKSAQKAQELYEFMRESGKYTAEQVEDAFKKAQDASSKAIGTNATQASKALEDLKSQYKSLSDSIANEAPEEVMGVIESQTRAQMAVLADQMDQKQRELDDQAHAIAKAVEDAINGIKFEPVQLDVYWNVPPMPKPSDPPPDNNPHSHLAAGDPTFPRPRGDDTRVVAISNTERVLTAAQNRDYESGNGGSDVAMSMMSDFLASQEVRDDRLADTLKRAFRYAVDINK